MEPKIIIRYRNATKQGNTSEFPLEQNTLRFGRDAGCEILFDEKAPRAWERTPFEMVPSKSKNSHEN